VGHNPVSAGAGAVDGSVDDAVDGGVGGVVGGAGDGACVGAGTGATVRGRPASAGPSNARTPAPSATVQPVGVPVAAGRSGVRTGSQRADSGKISAKSRHERATSPSP
jgi:hypothetical protein